MLYLLYHKYKSGSVVVWTGLDVCQACSCHMRLEDGYGHRFYECRIVNSSWCGSQKLHDPHFRKSKLAAVKCLQCSVHVPAKKRNTKYVTCSILSIHINTYDVIIRCFVSIYVYTHINTLTILIHSQTHFWYSVHPEPAVTGMHKAIKSGLL